MRLKSGFITRVIRCWLVGSGQRWIFEAPSQDWEPANVSCTSIYLHVPFCRNCCPYCPYTKVPYDPNLIEPYAQAAISEVDWWADKVGPAEITSIYIGGGTPTTALDCVIEILRHIRQRFHLTGEICIETNPTDINEAVIQKLKSASIALVSLGIQSFHPQHLALLGRGYNPGDAERALALLADSDFGSINVGLATFFLLAFAVTVVHFSIMVWYRKREEHAVPSKTSLSATTPQPPQKPYRDLKIAMIAVLVYILYLYASVEHGLTQIFTWLFFIFLILPFGNIFLKGLSKELNYPFLRLLAFFFVMYIFILMRDLAFGCYSFKPRFAILGVALMTYAVLSKLIGWVKQLFKT